MSYAVRLGRGGEDEKEDGRKGRKREGGMESGRMESMDGGVLICASISYLVITEQQLFQACEPLTHSSRVRPQHQDKGYQK